MTTRSRPAPVPPPDVPPESPAPPSIPLQSLRAARASCYPPDPIPNILPGGGVSLLAGASGIGKTAFLAWWATRFRDGLPIFGHPPAAIPGQAILAVDRSWVQSTSRWFELVGYPDIPAYSPLDDPTFKPAMMRNRKTRVHVFEHEILPKLGALVPGTLVWVDPIAPFLGGNLLDYDTCSIACMELRDLARRYQITFVGTAHTSKQKDDRKQQYRRVQDRILGTTALLGYTDTQMYLSAPDENGSDCFQFFWNPHHAPCQTFDLRKDPRTGVFIPVEPKPDAAESEAAPTGTAKAILDALALRSGLEPTGTPYATLIDVLGLTSGSVYRVLVGLIRDGFVLRVGRGLYKLAKLN